MPLAVKSRMMCGLLVLARSRRGPRRRSASASASACGLGRAHGPNTGPLSSVGCRGEMGHRSPSSPDLTCCWGGLPGLTRGTGAAARGRFGGPDSGEAGFPLEMAPGRRPGGRAGRRSVALPLWAGACLEARPSGRLVSTESVRFPPRENGAARGGQEARFGEGQGAPPTGGRFWRRMWSVARRLSGSRSVDP